MATGTIKQHIRHKTIQITTDANGYFNPSLSNVTVIGTTSSLGGTKAFFYKNGSNTVVYGVLYNIASNAFSRQPNTTTTLDIDYIPLGGVTPKCKVTPLFFERGCVA